MILLLKWSRVGQMALTSSQLSTNKGNKNTVACITKGREVWFIRLHFSECSRNVIIVKSHILLRESDFYLWCEELFFSLKRPWFVNQTFVDWPSNQQVLSNDSPWYNRTGWLGVKHQITFLHSNDNRHASSQVSWPTTPIKELPCTMVERVFRFHERYTRKNTEARKAWNNSLVTTPLNSIF